MILTSGYVRPRRFGISGGFILLAVALLWSRIAPEFVSTSGGSGHRNGGFSRMSLRRWHQRSDCGGRYGRFYQRKRPAWHANVLKAL
jgi:hypothetical protein